METAIRQEVSVRSFSRVFYILALASVVGSCSGVRESAPSGPGVDRDVITLAQLAEHPDAYTALLALRPMWLRARGPDSIRNPSQVWVYRNGTRIGGVETLREMNTTDILEIRFLDAAAASLQWGMGHAAGVISVTSRVR
jgi:hypothetical protein